MFFIFNQSFDKFVVTMSMHYTNYNSKGKFDNKMYWFFLLFCSKMHLQGFEVWRRRFENSWRYSRLSIVQKRMWILHGLFLLHIFSFWLFLKKPRCRNSKTSWIRIWSFWWCMWWVYLFCLIVFLKFHAAL